MRRKKAYYSDDDEDNGGVGMMVMMMMRRKMNEFVGSVVDVVVVAVSSYLYLTVCASYIVLVQHACILVRFGI